MGRKTQWWKKRKAKKKRQNEYDTFRDYFRNACGLSLTGILYSRTDLSQEQARMVAEEFARDSYPPTSPLSATDHRKLYEIYKRVKQK